MMMKRVFTFFLALMLLISIQAAHAQEAAAPDAALQYATQFTIEKRSDGCTLLTLAGTDRFLVVPEGQDIPDLLPQDTVVLKQPLSHLYLAATSAMDHFRALGCVDRITLSGTKESGWYIPEAAQAMREGTMRYAGKYSAPDFELFLEVTCPLAIESTMIYHTPEVKEQLETLGIPVLVERSSYESHPLGRMEWIKFYGVLLGREEEAERIFDEQLAALTDVLQTAATGKTVAFFFVNSMGLVNVHKPGDYIVKVIELAGGEYALTSLADDGNALSTMNMQMEDFYADAMDSDYLIYNSTIDGELTTLDQLIAKNELFSDFRAVREGHVYCTSQNLFQETMGLGQMILDVHLMLTTADASSFVYLKPLQ